MGEILECLHPQIRFIFFFDASRNDFVSLVHHDVEVQQFFFELHLLVEVNYTRLELVHFEEH